MKKIYLIGAGMGCGTLTSAARDIIASAEVIIGAKRLIEGFGGETLAEYRPERIREYIDDSDKKIFCVLLSGDTGFFSGAKGILEALDGYDTIVLAGISSFAYFFAALKKDYNDTRLLSLHGREQNIISHIKRYKSVFFLSGGDKTREVIQKLDFYGLDKVKLYIGERLSYPDEKITAGTAKELADTEFDALNAVIVENEDARPEFGSIPDSAFIRGNVPMTKAEIRSLCIARLNLSENSVLYDIGAGTGSVSIEAAQYLIDGTVCAFEKNAEAISLINANKAKFAADNITVIEGTAPDSFDFEKYPCPTHAFIGGSCGRLAETLEILFEKNHGLKAVVTAVSLNTISELTSLSKKYDTDICCINAARGEKAGSHILMKANNPVYIAAITEKKQ